MGRRLRRARRQACQTIILRKGGINEGREGFRVEHGEFWLLPTRFHQDASQLKPEARAFWETAGRLGATAGLSSSAELPGMHRFRIDLYAVVQEVFELHDLAAVEGLSGEHILSAETIAGRFSYRRPGLFVLAVRSFPDAARSRSAREFVHCRLQKLG